MKEKRGSGTEQSGIIRRTLELPVKLNDEVVEAAREDSLSIQHELRAVIRAGLMVRKAQGNGKDVSIDGKNVKFIGWKDKP